MSSKNKIIIAISIIFILAIIGIGMWFYSSNKQTPKPADNNDQTQTEPTQNTNTNPNTGTPPQRSTDDLTKYIVENEKSLVDSSTNLPIFTVSRSDEPLPGWYVMTLHNNSGDTSNATLVLRDSNGTLTKVAGPGTGIFNRTDLPSEVREAAKKGLE